MGNTVWVMEEDEEGIERLVKKDYLSMTPRERAEVENKEMRAHHKWVEENPYLGHKGGLIYDADTGG